MAEGWPLDVPPRAKPLRVAVIGSPGSGKSTLARHLAEALGAPHIELDAINWQPGWVDLSKADRAEFQRRVAERIAGQAWVTDGVYVAVRDTIIARSTHVVWLDYSRWVVMPRVIRRSVLRAVGGKELWPGTGNRELFTKWFGKNHPIQYAWTTFDRRRRQYDELFADPQFADVEKHRLRHPREARPLIERLAGNSLAA